MDDNLSIRVLNLPLNSVDGVISLITNCVGTPKSRWDSIVYGNLGQVLIQVEGCNLFQKIFKPVAIVDAALVKKWLQDPKRHHRVSFGLVHLLANGDQLYRQVGSCFLQLLMTAGLLLQLGKLAHQLYIKSANGLLVLVSLLILYFLAFTKPSDHPLVGHAPVLKGPHPHYLLK